MRLVSLVYYAGLFAAAAAQPSSTDDDFSSAVKQSVDDTSNIATGLLVGIICGSVACCVCIFAIIYLLFKSSTKQTGYIIADNAKLLEEP